MRESPASLARRQALRRYPALGFLGAAAALALLLPSRLTTPRTGPSTLAEYAPVPGQSTGAGEQTLGEASSGALGFGRGAGTGGGGAPAPTPLGGPGQPRPRTKRCVGSPPRQTEDPLSPPCVAFFRGDNGGATARGVTADEVRVVLQFNGSDRVVDYSDPQASAGDPQQEAFAQIVRAYARFFNDRYQTYGRTVRFFGYYGSSGPPERYQAHARRILSEIGPFALIPLGSSDNPAMAREAARAGILAAAYNGFDREEQRSVAPLLLSYSPDLQGQAALVASYVCTKLAGRPARHSGNVADRSQTRRFGLLYQDNPLIPEYRMLKDLTKVELSGRCGLSDVSEAGARTTNEGQADYAQNIAAMRAAGVTTLLFFSSVSGPLSWGAAADALKWYPEWVVPGSSDIQGPDENALGRQYNPVVWANAFGVTYAIRRNGTAQQSWYLAYREGCPDCPEPSGDFRRAKLYDTLTMLFWGIQAAGPRLTAANVDRGLHAIPQRRSPDPYTPAAYFGSGDFSWIKDAAEIWWDGTGQEPGGSLPGCYRLVAEGARYRAADWTDGDGGIKAPGQPCQGPTR